LISAYGVWYGAHHCPSDAGRGGAIAVALAFASLFVQRGSGVVTYKIVAEDFPRLQSELQTILESFRAAPAAKAGASGIDAIKKRVDGIFDQIKSNAASQTRQNWAIAASSIVGTLAWGFGDIMAQWLKTHFGW
jgi:hypothetical protein